jgi:hypothetical protein
LEEIYSTSQSTATRLHPQTIKPDNWNYKTRYLTPSTSSVLATRHVEVGRLAEVY